MVWVKPIYSRAELDAAASFLITANEDDDVFYDPFEYLKCLNVLNNWRSSHSFPLNTFQVTLRRNARKVYQNALVAQRIKRVPSILSKLRRYKSMKLSQMQDIGGCRAVLDSALHVERLRKAYLKSDIKHELVRQKDYIREAKDSGYRGIHLVYRYRSDKSSTYNGHQVEMQLRSRVQHAWATAVETVGTFLVQALKASEGSEQWLQFFALTSSAFALLEGTPTVPGTPATKKELRASIASLATQLQVRDKLRGYGTMLDITEDEANEETHYFLLELNPFARTLNVRTYHLGELQRATQEYLDIERHYATVPGAQAVLVAAGSLENLRRAYPNYYLDTEVFIQYLNRIIGPPQSKPRRTR